ncbi:MAG: helix-turn-helix domain-containing protein [Actinobacteria bacterium]|nr:helix-turn-helix domain-containing protein [Actinomycetota bacterium]
MSPLSRTSPEQAITLFLLWFRLLTLIHIAILILIGAKTTPILPFALAVIYNVSILIFKSSIMRGLRAYPSLLLIDMLVSFILVLGSGGFKSLYYLHSFSPLILGAFLFSYTGAFSIAGIQSVLFVIAIYANGYRLPDIVNAGEHILTYSLFFFLAGIAIAYLAELLNELDSAERRRAIIDFELEEVKRCLEPHLKANKLSEREIQVLILSLEGRTVEQTAQELGISKNTVKTYLSRAHRKLNTSSREEVVSQATRLEGGLE